MCGVRNAVRGGHQWRKQQGEEWRCRRRGRQRWHGVWCVALPVRADWASPAALPSPASGLHASEFEFISHMHTQKHTQCVSFCGCLMELKSHSSCSATFFSSRERFWIVCVLCISVAVHVHAPSDWLQGLRIWARNTITFSVFPTFHFSSCSFFSGMLAAVFLTQFLIEKYHSCSHPPYRPSLILLVWSLLHLCYTPHALCQLSASSRLSYVMGRSCLCL